MFFSPLFSSEIKCRASARRRRSAELLQRKAQLGECPRITSPGQEHVLLLTGDLSWMMFNGGRLALILQPSSAHLSLSLS